MRILVTGGAGFIGSHFARMMCERADVERVVVFDALTYAGNLNSILDLEDSPKFKFCLGRIQDEVAVHEVLGSEKVSHMVNFAAETHNDRSLLDVGSFIQTNVFGVHILFEATRKFGLQRMLHVSTDEVYGSTLSGTFTEQSPLEPNTPYSASKAGGDLQCRGHFVAFETPVVVTRGGNNYGPYQYPEKLIPFFATRLLEGKKVPVYGDGSQVREWIHVLDHCEGIFVALQKGTDGEIYNIGDHNERQNMHVVKVLLEETQRDNSFVKHIEDPRKGAHDARYSMTTDKIEALGWHPSRNFETELLSTVNWYRNNPEWWKKIQAKPDYSDFVQRFYGASLGADL
ncbi:MAG: dTDP-glucose 4,6-dehydratase [Armatimonadetes bacterium]|nr:dTDP-glucose 4,6-dehydratase [Armatimonadota bacterium]